MLALNFSVHHIGCLLRRLSFTRGKDHLALQHLSRRCSLIPCLCLITVSITSLFCLCFSLWRRQASPQFSGPLLLLGGSSHRCPPGWSLISLHSDFCHTKCLDSLKVSVSHCFLFLHALASLVTATWCAVLSDLRFLCESSLFPRGLTCHLPSSAHTLITKYHRNWIFLLFWVLENKALDLFSSDEGPFSIQHLPFHLSSQSFCVQKNLCCL